MLNDHFKLIYRSLLAISQHPTFFDPEKKLVQLAQEGLESMDAKTMYLKLVEIGLRQGFHDDEQKIITIAQDTLRSLLHDPVLFGTEP